ncbi:Glycosyl hydrolase family 109 protein 1 [Dissostichus eleginoides]|uniref:Glycosyl hydrolase family 109 protein 1 n=1 Tax=Dissostichus eleginoides TaxID=100907 RepID=A0AAD9BG80_DISEL|nr:Glycosyl hydrolase family 109 protein 1 [Dissostichus eleginoides]
MLGPAVAKPTHDPLDNLKAIIDIIGNRTGSATKVLKTIWVEDLTSLTGECKDKFFCKSVEVLNKTKHHMQEGDEALLRNLKAYIVGTHANCERPKKVTLNKELISQLSRQWISRVPECFFFILL